MWLALIAEFAHPHLVDRLMWPSPLGTRLANGSTDRYFQCEFHRSCFLAARRGPPPLSGRNDEETANIVAVSGKSSCKRLASYRKLIADVPQYWRNRSIPQTEHTLGAFIKRVPLHAFLWLASGAGLCQQRTMCRVLQLMNCGFCRLADTRGVSPIYFLRHSIASILVLQLFETVSHT